MRLLVIGMLLFIGMHLLPMFAGLRRRLIARLGDKRYKGLFALVSLAGFVLLVLGKAQAPFVPLWTPPIWGRHAALSLMPLALILLLGAYLPSNLKRFTAHPMLWGVLLWAVLHLLANGDLASLILFGGFGAYAVLDMLSANARGAHPGTRRFGWQRDAILIIAGFVVYGALLFLHPYLFGVAVLH
jgi:uncharacterized membrane protein